MLVLPSGALPAQAKLLSRKLLSNGGPIQVSRLCYQLGEKTESRIVKQRPADLECDQPFYQSFSEESLLYQTFAQSQCFQRCPHLIHHQPHTLVLEDLGPDEHSYPSEAHVQKAMAETFAHLHYHSAALYPVYRALKAKIDSSNQQRLYSKQQCQWFYADGAALLTQLTLSLDRDPNSLQQTLAQIQNQIESPGALLALVHSDVLNRRQSVSRNGIFMLLDFEQAKFSHRLLDVATTLCGKFERRRSSGLCFLNHPGFDLTFASHYRREFQKLRGYDDDEVLWQQALGSALVYASLINLGALLAMPDHYRGELSHNGFCRQVLFRLCDLLAPNPAFQKLTQELTNIGRRVDAQ